MVCWGQFHNGTTYGASGKSTKSSVIIEAPTFKGMAPFGAALF